MTPDIYCKDCPYAEKIEWDVKTIDGDPPSQLIIPDHLKRNCEGIPEGHEFASIRATCIHNHSQNNIVKNNQLESVNKPV